jgi:hypothetical protein
MDATTTSALRKVTPLRCGHWAALLQAERRIATRITSAARKGGYRGAVKLAGSSLALALLALAVLAGAGTAARDRAEVRCSGSGKPVLKGSSVNAIGRFHCSTYVRKATETIVLEGSVNGKWTTLESASRNLHPRRNTTYLVETPAIPCSANPHHENVRARFRLEAGSLELKPPPSRVLHTYCLGG